MRRIASIPLLLTLALGACQSPAASGNTAHNASVLPSGTVVPPAPEPKRLPAPASQLVDEQGRAVVSIADVVEKVLPSVVSVASKRVVRQAASPFGQDPFLRQFFGAPNQAPQREQEGIGSGVVVAEDLVLTNNHVVDKADTIVITTSDGSEIAMDVVGTDPKTDLAVLRVRKGTGKEAPPKLVPASFGDSGALRLGDTVIAVGNPFGVGQTVTMGIVSAKGRANMGIVDYEDFIQTDAAINPGNSGGALVNMRGEVIGINTAILSRSGGSVGIGFAIPTNMAKPIMESLLTKGKVVRGWLGVGIQELDKQLASALKLEPGSGVLVTDVAPDSPASEAKLQRGDVIETVSGQPVRTPAELRSRIASLGADQKVALQILRDGRKLNLDVTLRELPDAERQAAAVNGASAAQGKVAGMTLVPLNDALREKLRVSPRVPGGVAVVEVEEGSAGERYGIHPGDVILEVGRMPVRSPAELDRAWGKSAQTVLFLVYRQGATLFLAVPK